MQEAMLVLGMLLQRFEFVDYLNYELKVKGLTIKPDGLLIKIKQRPAEPPEPHRSRSPPRRPTGKPVSLSAPTADRGGHNTHSWCCSGPIWGPRRGLQVESPGRIRTAAITLGALDDHGRAAARGSAGRRVRVLQRSSAGQC